jgi:leucyl aminopeptidase
VEGSSVLENIFHSNGESIPIYPVFKNALEVALSALPAGAAHWARVSGFTGEAGAICLVPYLGAGDNFTFGAVLFGLGAANAGKASDKQQSKEINFLFGALPYSLPSGVYRVENYNGCDPYIVALAWGMGAYKFSAYKALECNPLNCGDDEPSCARFVPDNDRVAKRIQGILEGVFVCRNIVNEPPNVMGPERLEGVIRDTAIHYGAGFSVITGDDLLIQNYPLIHAVGRASAEEPRLIEMTWGKISDPTVTLVGKGVCYDTGGLCVKPASFMRNMKKDVGGAATVLALARMIMHFALPVRLRVLIPAVENSIAGNAFRPGDIIMARNNLYVEIHDTDAEGRLVLADALVEADEHEPDLLIDFATLTGAARVALGEDIVPFYTASQKLADEIQKAGIDECDPVWRMPLWLGYELSLSSSVADIVNASAGGASAPGSITAALFLQKFVRKSKEWVHFDCFSWNISARPSRPAGGECQVARAVFSVLENRYERK